MRTLLALLGLAALVVVVLVATGLLHLTATPGSLPSVQVNGGTAPRVKADLPSIDLGTTNRTVTLPTIHVTEPTGNSTTAAPKP